MFLSATFFLVAVSIALWLRWRRSLFNVFTNMGVPGPTPSIFFGNMLEMSKKGPFKCHGDWMKKYGDVYGYYYGSFPTLVTTNAEFIKRMLIKDFSNFYDRPTDFFLAEGDRANHPTSNHMINQKGKRWKEVRSLVSPSFNAGKLKLMMPQLQEVVNFMISKLEKLSENGTKDVDIFALYQGMAMDGISKVALGIESAVQAHPDHPILRGVRILFGVSVTSALHVLIVSFREFNLLFQRLMQLPLMLSNKGSNPVEEVAVNLTNVVRMRMEKTSARRNDLLQTLIDARASSEDISDASLIATATDTPDPETNTQERERPGKHQIKLTEEEVVANSFLFLLAGYESSSCGMGFLTHHLINNIDVQDQLREEVIDAFGKDGNLQYDVLMKLPLMDRVFSEALRMNPPIYAFVNRLAAREFQLGKWTIPAGMTVQVPVMNMHYLPEYFPDPTTFDPDRFLPENRGADHSVTWLAFGAGPRNCIGMRFALLETKVVFATLLRKFKLVPCGKTEMGELSLHFNPAFTAPKNGVYVRAIPL